MASDDFGFLDDLEESAMLGDLLGSVPSSREPSASEPRTRARSVTEPVRAASTILRPLERSPIGDVLASIPWSGSRTTMVSDKLDEHEVPHGRDGADDSDELGENYLHAISW
ncbi:MAG: hypothetical protein KDC95_09385 [Planctomycetes bacterium]|nr:hypothetical protein [Planctomycetota bacterium]